MRSPDVAITTVPPIPFVTAQTSILPLDDLKLMASLFDDSTTSSVVSQIHAPKLKDGIISWPIQLVWYLMKMVMLGTREAVFKERFVILRAKGENLGWKLGRDYDYADKSLDDLAIQTGK